MATLTLGRRPRPIPEAEINQKQRIVNSFSFRTDPANLILDWKSQEKGPQFAVVRSACLLRFFFVRPTKKKQDFSVADGGDNLPLNLNNEKSTQIAKEWSATTVVADLFLLKSVGTTGVTKALLENLQYLGRYDVIDASMYANLPDKRLSLYGKN